MEYSEYGKINLLFLSVVLFGVVLLHLAANAIDDCYDYQNGVDAQADRMFPRNFAGWKPIPRGYISLANAKIISYSLFGVSLLIGLYFWSVVGPWSFILALIGAALAIAYCAPPIKLDYRGFGLGELAIFFSFGPVPVLGSFYVQSGFLSFQSLLVSLPVGLMTVTILIDHDLIFKEVYSKSGKLSLATVLGRRNALKASLALTVVSYGLVIGSVISQVLPLWSLAAPIVSGLILFRKARVFSRGDQPPAFYVPFTENGLISNWVFVLILALSLLINRV